MTTDVKQHKVTIDGSSGFKAENGRYHLYLSEACPFAHRILIALKMKGLEDALSIMFVDSKLTNQGWTFAGNTVDPGSNESTLKAVYEKTCPGYTGRITIPALYDKTSKIIINNESADIVRMINSEFNQFCSTSKHCDLDLYPKDLQKEIDEINTLVAAKINNGVYMVVFSPTDDAKNQANTDLFDALDKIEDILSTKRYLCGDVFTEADIRLFTSLVRFDMIYHEVFKCNKKRLVDYPNLWAYTREIYQMPGVAGNVNPAAIFEHYTSDAFASLQSDANPTLSAMNLDEFRKPHNRQK